MEAAVEKKVRDCFVLYFAVAECRRPFSYFSQVAIYTEWPVSIWTVAAVNRRDASTTELLCNGGKELSG
jgi:hypothetical protein